jgi:methyl-accepting chemotaxis protein
MTDPLDSQPDPLVEAMRELSQAFQQQALAVSVIAREGALAAETAERAENAAKQAIAIATEVRDIARSIKRSTEAQTKAFEAFEIRVLKEFGQLARRVDALEEPVVGGANGHGT